MKNIKILALSIFIILFISCTVWAKEALTTGPKTSLSILSAGNNHFVTGKSEHPNQKQDRIKLLSEGQHPFAVIVCCSDSRVSPEIVFDQGLGDIFIVRTAGHVIDDVVLGSIEYAVEHLGVGLI
ncbi:MAG TPA: carbonic anhydrase, partial [Candidatus Wallbacteria bacterium]|nr:carbonic anhydrase [Candidatus Wallbacteria bacterium]